MEVATIHEKQWDARRKYAEYLRAVKLRHCAEYDALKNAYRELSRGNQVIDLFATMQQAGVDARQRPKLAIIKAHRKLCYFGYTAGNRPTFSHANDISMWGRKRAHWQQLPAGTFTIDRDAQNRSLLRAVVPTIPPSLMPSGDLSRYHILWEAEWETIPVDPMLLRSLGKNLYVVLATWDLTPLEQAILRNATMT